MDYLGTNQDSQPFSVCINVYTWLYTCSYCLKMLNIPQEETWKIIKNDTDIILQSKLHMPKTIFKSLKMPIKIWISHINALLIHLNPFIHWATLMKIFVGTPLYKLKVTANDIHKATNQETSYKYNPCKCKISKSYYQHYTPLFIYFNDFIC